MPSKRPAAILQHLERQAEAIKAMRDKIRDQLRRCQADELYLKKKLAAAPLTTENATKQESSAAMEVDAPVIVEPEPATPKKPKEKPVAPTLPSSDDEEDDEEEEEIDLEELPPSVRALRRKPASSSYGDIYDDYDDDEDEDDYASKEMRRILHSNR